jgi:5-methylthioribose kinase
MVTEPGARITPLGGGVSNDVTLVEDGSRRYVVKQSLGKLRVQEDWFSSRERIFREARSLALLGPLLPPGAVPEVLWEDRENFRFAMSAAPAAAVSWKTQLLAGEIRPETAETVARIQAAMIRCSWNIPSWRKEFGDLEVFEQLRLDPYYAFTATRHPDLAHHFHAGIERCRNERWCLVHGDWSPKNFMVDGESVMAIDFEVIHYGDPAFDSAFLLNHLLLKMFYRPGLAAQYHAAAARYWTTLASLIPAEAHWLERATLEHLPLLLLARMDGKSPAEYIHEESLKTRIRSFARRLLERPPGGILSALEQAAS